MTVFRRALLATAAAACLAAAGPAAGQDAGPAAPAPEAEQQPALVTADQLTFDDALDLVIASGDVELVQGARRVLADSITYNRRTNVVTAAGNVRMIEPNGDVLFGEYAELTDDLRQGFIDQVRMLLADNTRIAGTAAERTDDGRFVRVNRAVYSPCALCPDDPSRAPSWQIRSARVTHDRETKDVVHRDAQLEFLGVPFIYTPFLRHPDPTVDRRSGFLTPTFGSDANLGSVFRSYYYWDIEPQTDATIETTWSEEDGLLLGGEIRRRFASGRVQVQGSAVQADRRESQGGRTVRKEDEIRWHLFGQGVFHLTDTWRAGFDVQRTSDSTYLRRYAYSVEDLLTSRYYVEGFRGRSYAAVEAYQFQDLRSGNLEEEPLVLPRGRFSWLGHPGSAWGGRASLDGAAVALRRDRDNDYRRMSLVPGWERSWYTPVGVVATATALARTDLYWIDDPGARAGAADEEYDARFLPVGSLALRYPLVGDMGPFHTVVEPMVALTSAPEIGNEPDIVNEDSRSLEFTDRTLFRLNRFPGVDRQETGTRVTYGLETGVYGRGGGATSVFIGQSYRLDGDPDFGRNTGLSESRSDYVARFRLSPGSIVGAEYSTSLDAESLDVRRQELSGYIGVPALTLSGSYLYTTDLEPRTAIRNRTEFLAAGFSSQLSDRWSLSVSQARDFSLGRTGSELLTTSASLTYQDDCLLVQFIALDSNVQQADLAAGRSFYVRFVLRGLGEFATPRIGIGSLFGGGDETTTTRR